MGCQISVSVMALPDPAALSSRAATKISPAFYTSPIPNTSGLELLLQNNFLRSSFRYYCATEWQCALSQDRWGHLPLQHDGKIAVNCVDFWTDVADFTRLKSSPFRNYRAFHIYEKYIMHGATRMVPVSSIVYDDCSQAIFGGVDDFDPPFFKAAILEILDFLVAEVYFGYKKAPVDHLSRCRSNAVIHAMYHNFYSCERSLPKLEYKEQLSIVMNVLDTHVYFRSFRNYLRNLDAEQLLHAYVEILELREKLTHLEKAAEGEEEIKISVYLFHANSFYEKHLSSALPTRLPLPEATIGDFLHRLCVHRPFQQPDAFQLLEEACLGCILHDHLLRFLVSDEYFSVAVKEGALYTHASDELSSQLTFRTSLGRNVDEMNQMISADASTPLEKPSNVLSLDSTIIESCSLLRGDNSLTELKWLMRSGYDTLLGEYLKPFGKANWMHFYQSVQRFQMAHHQTDLERRSECQAIYDRYISRNAEEHIVLPDSIRTAISLDLIGASRDTFDEATDIVLQRLADKFWVGFKKEIFGRYSSNGSVSDKLQSQICSPVGTSRSQFHSFLVSPGASVKLLEEDDSSECSISTAASDDGRTDSVLGSNDDESGRHDGGVGEAEGIERFVWERTHCVERENQNKLKSGVSRRNSQPIVPPINLSATRDAVVTLSFTEAEPSRDHEQLRISTEFAQPCVLNQANSIEHKKCRSPARGNFVSPGRRNCISPPARDCVAIILAMNHRRAGEQDSTLKLSMKCLLEDVGVCGIFKEFLEKEGSPQTLCFLLEIAEFQSILSASRLRSCARKIFVKYIHSLAVLPLPISQSTRDNIEEALATDRVSLGLFRRAAEEVLQFMEVSQFSRFQHSELMEQVHEMLALQDDEKNFTSRSSSTGLLGSSSRPLRFGQVNKFRSPTNTPVSPKATSPVSPKSLRIDVAACLHSSLPLTATSPVTIGLQRRQSVRRCSLSNNGLNVNTKSVHGILQCQATTRFFKDFCKRSFCHENLLFWLDVENFVSLPESDYQRRVAHRIVVKYIDDSARMQVNISSAAKQCILVAQTQQKPHRDMFAMAQKEVLKLMETDSMPKFLQSPEYSSMLRYLREHRHAFAADFDEPRLSRFSFRNTLPSIELPRLSLPWSNRDRGSSSAHGSMNTRNRHNMSKRFQGPFLALTRSHKDNGTDDRIGTTSSASVRSEKGRISNAMDSMHLFLQRRKGDRYQ